MAVRCGGCAGWRAWGGGDACAGEFGDVGLEGFAESGECGGEFWGEGLGGGAQEEGELEAGLVGGGEEFELVGRELRGSSQRAGCWLISAEEGFGRSARGWVRRWDTRGWGENTDGMES